MGQKNTNLLMTIILFSFIFSRFTAGNGLRPYHFSHQSNIHRSERSNNLYVAEEAAKGELGMELYPTGSSLPDCSRACGPCRPCKRAMVSFKCSMESCPVVYRCICRGKQYHVPSN